MRRYPADGYARGSIPPRSNRTAMIDYHREAYKRLNHTERYAIVALGKVKINSGFAGALGVADPDGACNSRASCTHWW
jgi:hypothetical protein